VLSEDRFRSINDRKIDQPNLIFSMN
jgi:hypothetical protein